MTGEVNFLKTNVRYRIIHIADDYYLLDMERSIWLMFMPVLLWLMPQKMYKVDADIAKELSVPTSYTSESKGIVWLGAGGAAVLTPLVQPLLDQTIGSTIIVNLLLLIIVTTIFISLKLYIRKTLRNKVSRTVDIDRLENKTIRIWPKYFMQYINPFIFILFIGFWVVAMFPLFLKTSNLIPLIVYLIMLPLLLVLNMFFIDPRFGKKNLYRVSIVN